MDEVNQQGFPSRPEVVRCTSCNKYLSYGINAEKEKLCNECREKFIKYPIPKWLIIAGVLIMVIVNIQLFNSFPSGYTYRKLISHGAEAYAEKGYASAIKYYEEVDDGIELSTSDYCKLFIAYVRQYEYEKAGYILDEKIYGKEIKSDVLYRTVDNTYNEMSDYYDVSERFVMEYEKIMNAEPEEQVEILEAFIKGHPKEYFAHYMLSNTYFDLLKFEEALEVAKKAQTLKPNLKPLNNLTLAGVYRQIGEFEESYRLIESAILINKEDSLAICAMARTMFKEDKYEEALEYLLEQNQLVQDNEYFIETLAMAYHYNNMYEERDELVEQLLTNETFDSEFLIEVINNKSEFY